MVARTEAGDSELDGASCCGRQLRIIIDCLLTADGSHHPDLLVTAGCAALGHLVTVLGHRLGADVQHLLAFVDHVWPQLERLSDITVAAVCRLVEAVVRHAGTVLPPELMERLLAAGSPLRTLRLSHSDKVRSAVLAVYQAALGLKNVPLLQEAYRHVLADLQAGFLAATGVSSGLAQEEESAPEQAGMTGASGGLQLAIFCLQALAELASTRNSIIGLWALSPSIVDLLAVSLRPDDRRVSERQPLLRHMVLSLLYTHCHRHRHFLSTSRLTRSERTTPALVPSVAPSTGHNLATLLAVLHRLLTQVRRWCPQWSPPPDTT